VQTRFAINKIAKKLKTTGSVLDEEMKQRCHILTQKKLDISAWNISQKTFLQVGVSHSLVQNTIILIKLIVTGLHSA
jgi:hypothetical protein